MKKRNNLERAVVLGLLLSTSVYGSAWAVTIDEFKENASDSVISVTQDTTVNGTGYYGPDVSSGSGVGGPAYILNNSLFERPDKDIVNMTVTAGEVQLNFNNVNMLSPHIIRVEGTKGADITIENNTLADDPNNTSKFFAGINVSAKIEGNSLKVISMDRGIYTGAGYNAYPVEPNNYNVDIDVNETVHIESQSYGIFNEGYSESKDANENSDVYIDAGSVYINNKAGSGVYNVGRDNDLQNGVIITAHINDIDGTAKTDGNIVIKTEGQDKITDASVKNTTKGQTALIADGNITLDSADSGIWATKGEVNLTSGIGNYIHTVSEEISDKEEFGKGHGIHAEGSANVNLNAAVENIVYGAVYATGTDTKVNMKKFVPPTSTFSENNADGNLQQVTNKVYSATVIDDAGDIDTTSEYVDEENKVNNKFYNKKFVSSLYAEEGANIELTGENYIGTWANSEDKYTLERTVWAYSQADDVASTIKITGAAKIGTDNYAISPNSADVAIAAGTATKLDKTKVDSFDENDKRSTVTVEYDNFAGGGYSSISGDILSAYAGLVYIKAKKDSNAGIRIEGNLLAGNNGILKIDLGNGGYFVGRTDDYQDAGNATDKGTVASDEHLKFYDPAFSSTIYSSGKIELDMGQGSTWDVTGQSWVRSLKGEGIIDMRNDNEDLSSGVTTNANETVTDNNSHAVHIGTLTGKHTFVMDLNDTSHDISDMLYIKDKANSSGTHKVFLNSVAGLEDMKDGDKLRFATVNAGADKLIFEGEYKGENGYTGSKSRAMLYDTGFNNAAFEIKNETYSTTDTENAGYNGESFGLTKPGNEYVDKEYGNTATNWYLTRNSSGDEMSDGGKTILNMSRANYSNAIYMDRLNKRLGEARYINAEEDEGMWVCIRHDRIGKDDAYRSQNTMYELGYDQKQESDNGERRVGFAVDYMHGDTNYSDIAGKGEIDRYGLWLYDTWMGDKGHYVDYVAKWGHLSNDFEIYNSREKVDGDYSNNVFRVSAEYGRKKDIGNDWYFEPQAQLQLARVTGADYTTNQGTKVSVDGINSLIGRAGFRIGKDFGEQKQRTLYFKADVLHEFLGDQTIRALDATTGGNWQSVDYDNQGTWYDIGIGYAAMMSKNSYAFIDLEQSFGNDNDETYQINAGVQWSF